MSRSEKDTARIAGRVARIVSAARAVSADSNNMELRRAFLRSTFNLDQTVDAILAMADDALDLAVRKLSPHDGDILFVRLPIDASPELIADTRDNLHRLISRMMGVKVETCVALGDVDVGVITPRPTFGEPA